MPNSTKKGKRGEREFCRYLRDKGYGAIRAGQVSGQRNYDDSADVITSLDNYVRFEVKRGYNDVRPWKQEFKDWLDKMAKETPEKNVPVLAWRPDYADWMFYIYSRKSKSRALVVCYTFDEFEHRLGLQFGFMNLHPIRDCRVDDPSTWKTTDVFS